MHSVHTNSNTVWYIRLLMIKMTKVYPHACNYNNLNTKMCPGNLANEGAFTETVLQLLTSVTWYTTLPVAEILEERRLNDCLR
jgi:hypothetical protein